MSSKIPPIGIRLNNPGNIEWGSPWQGLVSREHSTYYRDGSRQQQRFCEFTEPAFGIRAIAVTLMTYHDKRKANDGSKIDTIREVIERWAPAFENDVRAYANHVQKVMCQEQGVCAVVDEVLDFRDYHTMRGLVVGIIAHENAGYKYPDAVVDEGLRRAGFVKPPKLVTPEAVGGAAVPTVAAAATLAPVVEPVIKVLQEQQDNLSSGSWIRIGVALILLAGVAAVTYSQWKKRKAGAV